MTQPIERDDLNALIRYHQESLNRHRWQMSIEAAVLEEVTVQALKHYRNLIDAMDNHQPEPEELLTEPSLPPQEAEALPEKPE